MKDTLKIGDTHTLRYVVPKRMTVPELLPDHADFMSIPAVLATAYMIALMELASTELPAQHIDDGEGSLVTHVDVSHVAATLVGQEVTIVTTVSAIEGRKITFNVTASDGVDTIGEGRHMRMVVPWSRFKQAVNRKAAKAGVAGLDD